ncbi:hypothetical protein M8494_07285 [Serratia ureilytica]
MPPASRSSTRYNGLIHDYGLLNPLAHVPAVHSAIHTQAGRVEALSVLTRVCRSTRASPG